MHLKTVCNPPFPLFLHKKTKKQTNTQKSLCGIRFTIYFTKQSLSGLPTLTRKRQTARRWDHLPEGFPSCYNGFPAVLGRAAGVTKRSQHYWSALRPDSVRRQGSSRHGSPFYSFVTLNLSFSLRAEKRRCHDGAGELLGQSLDVSDPSPSRVSNTAKGSAHLSQGSWCHDVNQVAG